MRIVSWNMARAVRPAGLDLDAWTVLNSLNADVALLQEARPPPPDMAGYFHIVPTRQGRGSAVWSRFPFSSTGRLPPGSDHTRTGVEPALEGYVASAVVESDSSGRSVTMTSVHAYPAPVDSKYLADLDVDAIRTPSCPRVWPGDLVWWATRPLARKGAPVIVGGDWNTSLLFDELYGPRGNREFFDRMRDTGWCDAMKKFHESEVQSYFRKGRAAYQLDHVFLTPDLFDRLQSAAVSATDQALGASDHAPLVLELTDL